jgi:glutamate synthase domain-containing protein 1
VLAAPFWTDLTRRGGDEAEMERVLRLTYGSLLLNGPFTVIIARQGEMVGLTDRIRLRPLVVATKGTVAYLSSEESAIRLVSPELDETWIPVGGQPVIARLGQVPAPDGVMVQREVTAGAH